MNTGDGKVYEAEDGTLFDTEEACEAYEDRMRALAAAALPADDSAEE